MYAFVILTALALALKVGKDILDEVLPVKTPAALTNTIAVALAAGFAWGIDYSVFASFAQTLRAEWMHPVLTGAVLIAAGEFIPNMVNAVSGRASDVASTVTTKHVRAA